MNTPQIASAQSGARATIHGQDLGLMLGGIRSRTGRYDAFDFDRDFHFDETVFQRSNGGMETRLDAGETLFFRRQLEAFVPQMFKVELGVINARSVLPISRVAGMASETITYRQNQGFGQAAVMAPDCSTDIPMVSGEAEEFHQGVVSLAIGAKWSLQDIRAAAAAGSGLQSQYAIWAKEGMMRRENDVAFYGLPTRGLTGLFNNANVPVAATALTTPGAWSNVANTAAAIADEALTLLEAIWLGSSEVEVPNTLLVPSEVKLYWMRTDMGLTGTSIKMIDYIVSCTDFLSSRSDIVGLRELGNFDGTGAAATNRAAIAMRRDSSKLEWHVPLDMEQLAPKVEPLSTSVIWHERVSGVAIYKPLSLNIATGI